ncbi:MAG: hypothetical protein Q9195_001162 [Heterodermia aff. obscurata]
MATNRASKAPKSSICPNPLIVLPLETHKETWIILHGRGSNAEKFGSELLATPIPEHQTLPQAFPHAKFIFPTASLRRAIIYKRSLITQWFDNWSLQTPTEREELQIDGLRETSAFIHAILREEIAVVGAENVILGGLSQGCAAALIATLLWDGEPLAAVFGMCGWLPYRGHMQEIAETTDKVIEDDPFAQCEIDEAQLSPVDQAIRYLRQELDLSEMGDCHPFQRIPIFLGHGVDDEKVPVGLGGEAAKCLRSLQGRVEFKTYEGLGHWYSEAMLRDISAFVKEQ